MLDAYRDLIDELLGTPTTLRGQMAEGDPPAHAVQLLSELRDRDVAVVERLQTMLRQRDAVLKPLPPASTAGADAAEALSGFESARGELVSLLMNLTIKDWGRTAIDEHGTEVTVAEEVEHHVEYDEDQVERILTELG